MPAPVTKEDTFTEMQLTRHRKPVSGRQKQAMSLSGLFFKDKQKDHNKENNSEG